jgi:midasin (ATPase involved in ribosome maturation)
VRLGFRLVATMNPGGDHGKRELSPALANRFTTVWVPPILDEGELAALLDAHLTPGARTCPWLLWLARRLTCCCDFADLHIASSCLLHD